jgi:DNA-directed RNA polymerase specialized sigma24 family protein
MQAPAPSLPVRRLAAVGGLVRRDLGRSASGAHEQCESLAGIVSLLPYCAGCGGLCTTPRGGARLPEDIDITWAALGASEAGAVDALSERVARIASPLLRWLPATARDSILADACSHVWQAARDGREAPQDLDKYVALKLRSCRAKHLRDGRPRRADRPLESRPVAPVELLELSELHDALEACVRAIPMEAARRAWELRVRSQYSATRTAEELGVPRGTVLYWWHKFSSRLALCLARKGFAP